MAITVQLQSVESPHEDATVCDFDELPDSAQDNVASAARSGDTKIRTSRVKSKTFGTCDVIRFTDYYRVTTE